MDESEANYETRVHGSAGDAVELELVASRLAMAPRLRGGAAGRPVPSASRARSLLSCCK